MAGSWSYNVPLYGLAGLGLRVISGVLPITSNLAVGTLEDFPHQAALYGHTLSSEQWEFLTLLPFNPLHPNMPYGFNVIAP